jgi:hypothetical protein
VTRTGRRHFIEDSMPLSPPAPREHRHTRQIECRGYRREDGLWDIEGHLTDIKSYAFDNAFRGRVEAGVPVHDMWVRLTVDAGLKVHAAEAETVAGPYRICPQAAPAVEQLAGLTIGPGWRGKVRQRIGGTNGCTHIVEMLQPLATVAFQTVFADRRKWSDETKQPDKSEKPPHIDSCYALRSDGEAVREHYPTWYTGATGGDLKAGD